MRLLGRLLGQTVRQHEGQEAFERIEFIRRLSISASRNDREAAAKLDALLNQLTAREALSVIRAFSYFLHLGNIAEDLHPLQQRARAEAAGENAGSEPSLAKSFAKLRKASIGAGKIAQVLARAWISPVLTAHPTEVRRKSLLDAEHAIFSLLAEREHLRGKSELSRNEEQLLARVSQLWQTELLRHSRLSVRDEIENTLSYYRSTFLTEIPNIYADVERRIEGLRVPPFLRMGTWVGGDRDGNPNVVGRFARDRAQDAGRDGAALLSDRSASARRPAFDLQEIRRRDQGGRRPGAAIARRQSAPRRRALSPRAHRRLFPARGDARQAHRPGGAAPRRRAGRALRQ